MVGKVANNCKQTDQLRPLHAHRAERVLARYPGSGLLWAISVGFPAEWCDDRKRLLATIVRCPQWVRCSAISWPSTRCTGPRRRSKARSATARRSRHHAGSASARLARTSRSAAPWSSVAARQRMHADDPVAAAQQVGAGHGAELDGADRDRHDPAPGDRRDAVDPLRPVGPDADEHGTGGWREALGVVHAGVLAAGSGGCGGGIVAPRDRPVTDPRPIVPARRLEAPRRFLDARSRDPPARARRHRPHRCRRRPPCC